MNQNGSKSSGWTLCPSKSFPGKFYYFNVLTGETAWSVSDTDIKSLNKHPKKYSNYPEPSYHPDEPKTPKKPYSFEKTKSCLKNSNFESPPLISSTQEFLTNSYTNKYVPNVYSPILNYKTNPFDFSTPNDHSEFPTHGNSNDFATHENPDLPIRRNSSDFSTLNEIRDFSVHSNVDFATLSSSNDLSSNPTDFTIPCNSTPVTSSIRLPSLKLVEPTSTKSTENVPKYIWALVPIEYVNDKSQINGKTQDNKRLEGPTVVATQQPLKRSVKNLSPTFIETETIQVHREKNENSNGPTFVSTEQPFKRSVKNHPLTNHPLTNLNEMETVTSQSIINSNEEAIRPKTDNLELIKKFRDKFNSYNANNSNSEIQRNLNPISESITPKIIRKINRIPEFESKIMKIPDFEAQISKITEFESKISSKEVFTPKKTLSESDKVENKEDYLDNLSENDLRKVLVKRKLEINKNNEVPEKKARSEREAPVTPKKKVTFQLDLSNDETSQELIDDEEPERQKNHILSKLKQLGAIDNTEWYIVVDLNVVQESFDFLHTFVQDDPFCKLLIPYSVYSWLSTLSLGESRGARLVQLARQTLRRIDVAAKSDRVKVEKLTDLNEKTLPQNEQILNCCFKLIFNDIHVVLITDSNILYKKALDNGIHVYKIEEIQYVDNNEHELSFDIQKFKFAVPNVNCSTENTVNEDPNLNEENKKTSSILNSNLNNDRTSIPNSNTERIRKNLFGPENPNENNKVSNLMDMSNLSDISECAMISTDICKTIETQNNTQSTEKPEKVLSTFFTQEKSLFKIPNFKNFIIQSKNTGKDTQLKVIGENVTQSKETGVKNTQTKDTEVKSTHFKDTGVKNTQTKDTDVKSTHFQDTGVKNTQTKDTEVKSTHFKDTRVKNTQLKDAVVKDNQSNIFDKNRLLRQLLLKDTGLINTQIKVTRDNVTKLKDTEIEDTRENNTQIKDTTERCSIFEIDSNFMPVTFKTIEDELKRFFIKDKIVQDNFERRIDEYYCTFRQIFEGLYDIIKDIPNFKYDGKKIWSIYDGLQILRKNGDKRIQLISEKLIEILHEYDYQGTAKMKIKINPDELMQIIGCGILLVKYLKEIKETPELLEMGNDLNNLLKSIENPEEVVFDVPVPDMPKINKTDKPRDRKNFIKPREEIIDYLKEHFPHWKDYEESEADEMLNKTPKSSKVNIVRTSGKNLSSIKLNRTKIIMDNTTKNTKLKTITNNKETEKSSSRNKEIQIQNDENIDLKNQNIVSSTEPIMIRSLNGIAQENEKIDYNLNETKHQNTFSTITNGPRVICKIAPIKEFEEKIKNDLDQLEYSEMSNNESNISELSVRTDGNIEENIELTKDMKKVVLNDDKCLNGENNGITKTSTFKTLLNRESTRTHSINEENKRIDSFIDLPNDDSNMIILLNDDNRRIDSSNNNNTRTHSLNEKINSLNEIINSLNIDNTRPYLLNEKMKSLNEGINSLNDDFTKANSLNEKTKVLYDDSNKTNLFNERIHLLNDESNIIDSSTESNRHEVAYTCTSIKELNSLKIKRSLLNDDTKRTVSLNDNRKRIDFLTSSIQNIESSSNGTKSTLLVIEDDKRTGSLNRTRPLSPSSSILNDIEDDVIIIEDDNCVKKKCVQFVKSFFKEIFENFRLIVIFCENSLRDLERLNRREIGLIKNKALKVQNVLNKWITILLRISIREEHEGTFKALFTKNGNNIRYVSIIEKCLDQANSLEFIMEQIIMKT